METEKGIGTGNGGSGEWYLGVIQSECMRAWAFTIKCCEVMDIDLKEKLNLVYLKMMEKTKKL